MEIVTENNKKIQLNKLSYRELTLTAPITPREKQMVESSNIKEILIDDISFKVNTTVTIYDKEKSIPFKINYIIKLSENKYSLLVTKLNVTSKFLPPLHFSSANSLLFTSHFMNAYLGYETTGITGNMHYVFRYTGDLSFYDLEKNLMKHPLYVSSTPLDDYHLMFELLIGEDNQEIYEIFLKGQYSKFPQWYKDKIYDFYKPIVKGKIQSTNIYKILTKSKQYKMKLEKELEVTLSNRAELCDKPGENDLFGGEYLILEEQWKH